MDQTTHEIKEAVKSLQAITISATTTSGTKIKIPFSATNQYTTMIEQLEFRVPKTAPSKGVCPTCSATMDSKNPFCPHCGQLVYQPKGGRR